MKILFSFILLCFLISSCDKDISIANGVTGTVLDKTTNIAVSEAEVGLFEKDAEIFGGLGGVLLETKYSDTNGSFHFDFTEREGYNYYAQAIKDQYFNDQSNNISYVHFGEENTILYLQPEGYLKVRFINLFPCNENDEITLSLLYDGYYPEFIGDDVDTTICCFIVYGNSNNHITHYVDKCGESENISEDIFCLPFDTTYYEIYY